MDDEKALWKKCAEFHGHECGGLTIGYKAALYAKELLDLDFSEDEQVVCISENDACGVDAIQVILGCSVGKGNLLFHICGKQAFSFYDRGSGRSVRLVLKEKPREMTKAESFAYYQACEPREMFDVKETFLGAAPEGGDLRIRPVRLLRRDDRGKMAPGGRREKAVSGLSGTSFREISIRKTSGHSPADLGSRK